MKSITPNNNSNHLIQGDNLDVLTEITKAFAEKVDVIYIDPPYNTKKNHFRYSDSMTNVAWTEFMSTRLKLAKNLMAEHTTIMISIGDQGYPYLKILCDEIFGEDNFVVNFIWKKSHTFKNDSNSISNQHEYVLCYAKNKKKAHFNLNTVDQSYINKAYRYEDSTGRFRVVPLYKDKNKQFFTVVSPNGTEWTKHWNYNEDGFAKLIAEDKIYYGRDGNACPSKKVYLKEVMTKTFGSILDPEKVGYTGDGVKELKRLGFMTTDFLYPKPVNLISHLLEITAQKDSLVLDFFAGSGTTGQAVMKLNAEDGGNRQFILITNSVFE